MHELPAQRELLCPIAIGEEAEIADTLEAVGTYVKQEPTMNSSAPSVIVL